MVCYFIVLFTSLWKRYHLSVEKGIFLWISVCFNVLRSCDLSEQSITTPRKCQDRRHKFFEGLTVKKHQKPL